MIYLMPVRPAKQVERDRKFFQLAGIRNVIGLPGEAERKHAFDPATGRFEPEASRLARSIRELGDADIDNPASWSLNLASEEKGAAALALGPLMRRPLVACAPGTKMQAKDWGQDNWRLLLSWLQSRFPEFGLALIGSQDDTDVAEFASRDWSGPKVNLCGKLTPRESAAVMEHARIFLGPDSAPMHLAACVGTPCVAVFSARTMPGTRFPVGPVHQAVYHQTSCYGCQLETCVAERRRCLTSIPVNEVADAICRVLERSPEGRITVRGKVVQR
jgi:ADP-heptose:LPS heptosyltransferase